MATTADVWVLWTDFEQVIVNKAIDQWRKWLRAFMKAKGEHLEHLLWLAVAYYVLLRCIVSNNIKVFRLFSSTQPAFLIKPCQKVTKVRFFDSWCISHHAIVLPSASSRQRLLLLQPRGVVVASLVLINKVNLRWARLILGWVTVSGLDS